MMRLGLGARDVLSGGTTARCCVTQQASISTSVRSMRQSATKSFTEGRSFEGKPLSSSGKEERLVSLPFQGQKRGLNAEQAAFLATALTQSVGLFDMSVDGLDSSIGEPDQDTQVDQHSDCVSDSDQQSDTLKIEHRIDQKIEKLNKRLNVTFILLIVKAVVPTHEIFRSLFHWCLHNVESVLTSK